MFMTIISYSTVSFKDRGERFTADALLDNKDVEVAKIHYISGENSCLQKTTPPAQNKQHATITNTSTGTPTTVEPSQTAIAPSENYSYVTITAVRT